MLSQNPIVVVGSINLDLVAVASKIPSIGVPAASALARGRHPAAAYNLYAIERDGNAWRCEQIVRGIDNDMQIREIGRKRLI